MIVYRELSSITSDLGVSAKTLYALSNSIPSFYSLVTVPKKNGGERTLHIPHPLLKSVQRKIAEKLLSLERISPYATAYKHACSVYKNACPHVGKKQILKLDIKSFFNSISYALVKEKAFPCFRYSENIRILLSMLCYKGDALPQGAPTSPAISNIILYDFDMSVGKYCKEHSITYTRYCDDLTFSADTINVAEMTDFVKGELKKYKLVLNNGKTKLISDYKRQSVTGIIVNKKPNIAKEYKRSLRKEIYYIEKFGIRSHINHVGITVSEEKYLLSIQGKINYVLSVCPDDNEFSKYKSKINNLIKTYK